MIRQAYVFLMFSLFLFSCNPKSINPGFTRTESGLEYKIHTLGDENLPIKENELLFLSVTVFDESGQLIASNRNHEYDTAYTFKHVRDNLFMEGISHLVVGDSATFYLTEQNIESLFPILTKENVHVFTHVKVLKSVSKEWYTLSKSYPNLAEAFPNDYLNLANFLKSYSPIDVINVGDMYFISLKNGNKLHPESKQKVTVDYEAFFTDGEKFDSTFDRDHSFEYTVGESGQVLLGFDIGVRQMCEGSEALFILPAHLAFSTRGSTDGTVPPNTTVIYQVKLNSIQNDTLPSEIS